MGINEQLEALYTQYYDNAVNACHSAKLEMANPLLLKVSEDDYSDSDIKVMILGQETYGWFDKTTSQKDLDTLKNNNWIFIDEFENAKDTHKFGSVSIKQLMYEYDKYLNNDIRGKQKRTFWKNGFNWFSEKLKAHYSDKKLYFIWNNISKFGQINETGVTGEIRRFEKEHFHVVAKELEILKPNIVIFLTGPDRDNDIKANFGNIQCNLVCEDDFILSDNKKRHYQTPKKILVDNISSVLPPQTIRLYHPNYYGGYNKVKQLALDTLKKFSYIEEPTLP